MRLAFLLLLLAAVSVAQSPAVSRPAVTAVERNIETRLLKADPADPFEILAFPQGVYLEGYGVVFTTKINLILTLGLSPFRPQMSPQDVARVRERKLKKIDLLHATIREILLNAAASLDPVPRGEQVVLSVSLFHSSWENTEGLPNQIVMQGPREKLLNRAASDSAIKTKVF
jgi:hypothetical protein